MKKAQKKQCQTILSNYGHTDQKAQAIEELLELATILQKSRRKSKATITLKNEICSEIADCAIMMQQLFIIFDKQLIKDQISFKLDREIERIY